MRTVDSGDKGENRLMTAMLATTHFPRHPEALERDQLNGVYLELRSSYKSLMYSRGAFRGQAERNRSAMQELETKLRAMAEREASVRKEAYEMLEIVTNVVGELENAGDALVNEFGLYQKGKSTYQGGSFIGRLIKALATFIRRWTGTKQQLAAIVDKQQAVQLRLEGTDGSDR